MGSENVNRGEELKSISDGGIITMGQSVPDTITREARFSRNFDCVADVEYQIGSTFFKTTRESWGPHTIAYIPTVAVLDSAIVRAERVKEFSELFPIDGSRGLHAEESIARDILYGRTAVDFLDTLSPDNWGEFTVDFTLPLTRSLHQKANRMNFQMAHRHPSHSESIRGAEYEVMREVIAGNVLPDVANAANKHLQPQGSREYALEAIEAALHRNYQRDTVVVSMQMRLLVGASNEVLMMYAFILSKLEHKDVFSSYALQSRECNRVIVQWDFSE